MVLRGQIVRRATRFCNNACPGIIHQQSSAVEITESSKGIRARADSSWSVRSQPSTQQASLASDARDSEVTLPGPLRRSIGMMQATVLLVASLGVGLTLSAVQLNISAGEHRETVRARVEDVLTLTDGASPRFPLIPWARALREVELGAMDGIVLLLKTRERYMVYTDPLITARSLIWYETARYPEGIEWSTIADLEPYTIGVVRGYEYGPEIERGAKTGKLRLVEVNAIEQLFTILARGRIDIALANDTVGFGLAGKHAGEVTLRAADWPTGEDVYHMAFSRKSDAAGLVGRINEVIAGLRREGVVDAISRGNLRGA